MKSLMKHFTLMAMAVILLILNGCGEPCEDVACLNGGACQDGTCICPDGFTGENCQSTIDPCDNVTCMNGGNCVDGSCECPIGWGGEFCETQLPQRMIINEIIINDFPITHPAGYNWTVSNDGVDMVEPNIFATVNDDVFSSGINQTMVEFDALPANGPYNFDANNSPNMPFVIVNVQDKNVAFSLWHRYYYNSNPGERLMGGYVVEKITDSYPDTSIRIYDPNSDHQIDMTIEVEWEF